MSNKSDVDTAKYTPFDARAFERPLSVSSLVRVDAGALTDRGKVRPNNEDHFLVVRYGRSVVTWMTNLAEGQVPDRFEETGYGLAVADGMGGAAAGELASSMALTVAVNLALHHPSWI